MTREQAQHLVDRGLARWLESDVLEIAGTQPAWRYADLARPDNYVVDPGSPSIVRFLGKQPNP